MTKRFLPLLLLPFILLACTTYQFQFALETEAEVIGFTNHSIGLKYDIYGTHVFQDVFIESLAEFSYFKKMKKIPLTVLVKCDDYDQGDRVHLTLFYRGNKFGNAKDVRMRDISMKVFIDRDSTIPNFKWFVFNEVEYEDGITPEELRKKLADDGEEPPEKTVQKEENKGEEEKKSL
jgi:hypothetical protein